MIKVLYFARYREMLGFESEQIPFADEIQTVEKLMAVLSRRGDRWAEVFDSDRRVLVAINQDMANPDAVIHEGDEVAFFPPVTGG